MASDWTTQLAISVSEMLAEQQAQTTMIQANISGMTLVNAAQDQASYNNYSTDANISVSRAEARVTADGLEAQGQIQATQISAGDRIISVTNTTTAQTLAAQQLSSARQTSAFNLSAARVAQTQAIENEDVAVAQLLSTTRLNASQTISNAQIAAQQSETNARIATYYVDQTTRESVATTLANARIAGTTEETTDQITARQTITLAQTAAAQTVATARIAAEQLTTTHRIQASFTVTTAQISAAQISADASVYSTSTVDAAETVAEIIIVAAKISALNSVADEYVADVEAAARIYAADKELAGREYSSDKQLSGGEYAADKAKAGDIYSAQDSLTGSNYASLSEYNSYIAKANTDSATSAYVSQKQVAGVVYSTEADQNRLELKIAFEQERYNDVWPYIQTILALTNPPTPGLDLTLPYIATSGAIPRPLEDSTVAILKTMAPSLAAISSTNAANRINVLGFSSSFGGLAAIQNGYMLGGLQASIGSEALFRIGCLETNAQTMAKQNQTMIEAFNKMQGTLADAENNLSRRQVGLVAGLSRIGQV